jgi:hypothetical protein
MRREGNALVVERGVEQKTTTAVAYAKLNCGHRLIRIIGNAEHDLKSGRDVRLPGLVEVAECIVCPHG